MWALLVTVSLSPVSLWWQRDGHGDACGGGSSRVQMGLCSSCLSSRQFPGGSGVVCDVS